jgi:DNA-binding NarL/FixJ family response regulator
MPALNGIEVTSRVAALKLPTRCIILALRSELLSPQRAFRAGASGCLLKESAFEDLVELALRAASGETGLGNLGQPQEPRRGLRSSGLSRREMEVLRLVARGFTSKRIADALFISPYTVDSHRQRIMQKLEISNGPGLVKYALENGLD